MRGRVAQPTAARVLRGNRQKRSLPVDEPQYPKGTPCPPSWLGPEAVAIWHQVLPTLAAVPGLLSPAHADALGCYCDSIASLSRALRTIEKNKTGEFIETVFGVKAHPAVKVRNDAMMRILKFGQEFGITPSAATRVKIPKGKENDGDSGKDPLEAAIEAQAKHLRLARAG